MFRPISSSRYVPPTDIAAWSAEWAEYETRTGIKPVFAAGGGERWRVVENAGEFPREHENESEREKRLALAAIYG